MSLSGFALAAAVALALAGLVRLPDWIERWLIARAKGAPARVLAGLPPVNPDPNARRV